MVDTTFHFPRATGYAEDWRRSARLKQSQTEWFKHCMGDFPIMFTGKALFEGKEVYATMEIPDVVLVWFNKWFSQFVEGG